MSPLIDLQRRLVEVGRIRLGEKNAAGYPTRLQTWKLTSRDKVRLDAAAEAYGGTSEVWEGHDGQWKLYTETDALPILLLPGQTISQNYELWSGGGCQRRCDGEQEQISDGHCLCDPENRECKPHTRLAVMLPDVPGVGCWRLDTQGYYAAAELAGVVDLLEMATARGILLPARLRIDQRTQLRGGQTRHFPVPTLDLDIRPLEMISIARGEGPSEQKALPAAMDGENGTNSYVPLPASPRGEATLAEGLAAVESGPEANRTRSARSAAPIGDDPLDDFLSTDPVPVPDDTGAPTPQESTLASEPQQRLIRARADFYGLSDNERHEITEWLCGQPSSKDVLADQVDTLLAWFEIEGATKNLLQKAATLGRSTEAQNAIAEKRQGTDPHNHEQRVVLLGWLTDQINKAARKLEALKKEEAAT